MFIEGETLELVRIATIALSAAIVAVLALVAYLRTRHDALWCICIAACVITLVSGAAWVAVR